MGINFIHYLPPHGEKVITTFQRPDEIFNKAEELKAQGFEFSMEIISTGEVVFYCGKYNDDTENIRICKNVWIEIIKSVDELIIDSYHREIENKR